jgi:hypothetical protein
MALAIQKARFRIDREARRATATLIAPPNVARTAFRNWNCAVLWFRRVMLTALRLPCSLGFPSKPTAGVKLF